AAPFVGEQNFLPVIRKRRRVPVCIIRIVYCVEALWIYWIFDVEQEPISGARAGGKTHRGVDSNVVTLIGVLRLFWSVFAMAAAATESVQRAGSRIHKQPWTRNDLRFLRRCQRYFDHLNPEQRRIRILVGLLTRAPGQLFGLADKRRPGHVDVNVVLVIRIHDERVRVRATTSLHSGHLLWIFDIADIKNSHAAETIFLRGRW